MNLFKKVLFKDEYSVRTQVYLLLWIVRNTRALSIASLTLKVTLWGYSKRGICRANLLQHYWNLPEGRWKWWLRIIIKNVLVCIEHELGRLLYTAIKELVWRQQVYSFIWKRKHIPIGLAVENSCSINLESIITCIIKCTVHCCCSSSSHSSTGKEAYFQVCFLTQSLEKKSKLTHLPSKMKHCFLKIEPA